MEAIWFAPYGRRAELMSSENKNLVLKPLIGTDEATIDDKGRVLVGKKKRDRLGESFVLALGAVGCLVIYPEAVWDRLNESLDQYDVMNHGMEQYTRLIFGTAEDEVKFDAQGRLVLPEKLRKLASLSKRVLIVGARNRLEIWDPEEFGSYEQDPDTYGLARRDAIERAYALMTTKGGA